MENHNLLPQATRANNLARAEFEEIMDEDRPHIIRLRPIRRAGHQVDDPRVFNNLARSLRGRVQQRIRQFTGWSTIRVNQNARVVLVMTNWNDSQLTNAVRNISPSEITGETFMDLFEGARTAGSAPRLSIYDVYWTAFIIPTSLFDGGKSSSFRNVDNLKGIGNWDKKIRSDGRTTHESIGCASLAIACGLNKISKKFSSRSNSIFKQVAFTRYCKEIQTKLNLTTISTLLELDTFATQFPDHRLVIISSVFTRSTIHQGEDYTHNSNHKLDKTVYIYHDLLTKHFVEVTSITELVASMKNSNTTRWCHTCCTHYSNNSNKTCNCNAPRPAYKAKTVQCKCGQKYRKGDKHRCGESSCHFCTLYFNSSDLSEHRCPLYIPPKQLEKVFKGDENPHFEDSHQHQPEAWIWDIESHFVLVPDEETEEYETDEFGKFKLDENDKVITYSTQKLAQLPNYIWCKNPFTGEEKEFTSMDDFITFAVVTQNKGYNYFYAHNSSGYDTRLLFEAATRLMKEAPEPIFKGTRFMRLTLKNCIFQDTMLHLAEPLASLGRAFSLPLTKGHFPHLFSTLENLDYVGRIPDKQYFDLTFSCKSKEDFDDFNSWYDNWHNPVNDITPLWNYQDQRRLYCQNDVRMLSSIFLLYHQGIIDSLRDYSYLTVSPWFFPTMAGHVHKLMVRHLHNNQNLEEMTAETLKAYAQSTWCAIEPEEQYYARLALRGGMTGICKYIHEGPIDYIDIQSSYPSVQMDIDNLYPVGSPTIEIHDKDYYPCGFHYTKPLEPCTHTYDQKVENTTQHRQSKLNIIPVTLPPGLIHHYCLAFDGIITVDITPPRNLYHTLIQTYDKQKNKVIGSLLPIKCETIPSPILHEAIKIGYTVTKIYRADRYKMAESKFRNGLLGDMYIAKMKNGGEIPTAHQERIYNTFKTKFNIDLGDVTKFIDNPTAKKIAKGPITSAWGKHAESLDHVQSTIVPTAGNLGHNMYKELLMNNVQIRNIRTVGCNTMFDYSENRSNKRPELHKTYLPVAVFVTAYGRIKLWKQLIAYDPPGTPNHELRVLMYDTDSIIPIHDPNGYNVPTGDCLGDWEVEKIQRKHNGLAKFYAIGPKSYTIVCGDGYEELKLKGATVKYAHSDMISGSIMKSLVLSKNPSNCNPEVIDLPQRTFDYRLNKGVEAMTVRKFRKKIQFNLEHVKGTFDWSDYRAYPEGYRPTRDTFSGRAFNF